MKSSFTKIYIHLVFATKHRVRLHNPTHRDDLVKYIAGIIQNHQSHLYAGKVMPDHVHLLIGVHPTIPVSDLARAVKANSSRHINEQKWVPGKFNWGEGYGAFSCSESVIPSVTKYIAELRQLTYEINHPLYPFHPIYPRNKRKSNGNIHLSAEGD